MAESAATEWIEKTYVPWTVSGEEASERITPKSADAPERWNQEALKAGTCYTVFCAPLPDVFEDRTELIPLRNDLWRLIKRTPFLNWMVLTRCIGNVSGMLPADWDSAYDNVCLMVVVENQRHFDERVPLLQEIPVKYRALLIEPLTGALQMPVGSLQGIDLVIVGGGVGKGACPMNPDWVRHVRDACAREAISFSFRQWGSWTPDRSRRNADLSNGAVFTAYNAEPVLLSTLETLRERRNFLKEPGAQAVFYVRNRKENDNLLDGREYNARIPLSRFGANTGLVAVIPPLSAQEQTDFSKLETIVTKGLIGFWKAGEALREIRDRGLYRGSYPNFEAYCRTKWEMSRAEAYRQIGAAEVIGDICTDGSVRLLPENLAQSRPLFSLKNPAQRRQA